MSVEADMLWTIEVTLFNEKCDNSVELVCGALPTESMYGITTEGDLPHHSDIIESNS